MACSYVNPTVQNLSSLVFNFTYDTLDRQVLDEFDTSNGATNVTWRLHTRANVSLNSATTATLTSTATANGTPNNLTPSVVSIPSVTG